MIKEELRFQILKALADETRLRILELLRHGEELCVCEIQKIINKSQSTTSQHLKTLTDANVLVSGKKGSKMMYKIRDFQVFKTIANIDKMIKNINKFKEIVSIQEEIKV